MPTIKSYTDLEQSRKLVKILPVESADMYYHKDRNNDFVQYPHFVKEYQSMTDRDIIFNEDIIPCWSLAALLNVLPNPSLHKTFSGWRCDSYNKEGSSFILDEVSDNPVDACVNMIIKLHELKMLYYDYRRKS